MLNDGVGELELAAAFDPYAEHSLAARTVGVMPNGDSIRSRHGLTFVARTDLANASDRFDRLWCRASTPRRAPTPLALRPLLLGLAGLAVAFGAAWLVRRTRTRRSGDISG